MTTISRYLRAEEKEVFPIAEPGWGEDGADPLDSEDLDNIDQPEDDDDDGS